MIYIAGICFTIEAYLVKFIWYAWVQLLYNSLGIIYYFICLSIFVAPISEEYYFVALLFMNAFFIYETWLLLALVWIDKVME